MVNRNFPSLAVIILLFAIAWILSELNIIDINIPWIPVIVAIIAIGMIVNRYVR